MDMAWHWLILHLRVSSVFAMHVLRLLNNKTISTSPWLLGACLLPSLLCARRHVFLAILTSHRAASPAQPGITFCNSLGKPLRIQTFDCLLALVFFAVIFPSTGLASLTVLPCYGIHYLESPAGR